MDLTEMIIAADQQSDDTPVDAGYLDGRIAINYREKMSATAALDKLFTAEWIKANRYQVNGTTHGLTYAARTEVLRVVLCAINTSRLGLPEGTVATHPDGRVARRYYSREGKQLKWLVIQPPSDANIEVDQGPELPGEGWEISKEVPWNVEADR